MQRTFKALTIIVLLTVSGCFHSADENDKETNEIEKVSAYLTGTIKEINGDRALVYDGKGNLFVDLSVNNDETF